MKYIKRKQPETLKEQVERIRYERSPKFTWKDIPAVLFIAVVIYYMFN